MLTGKKEKLDGIRCRESFEKKEERGKEEVGNAQNETITAKSIFPDGVTIKGTSVLSI